MPTKIVKKTFSRSGKTRGSAVTARKGGFMKPSGSKRQNNSGLMTSKAPVASRTGGCKNC